MRLRASALLFFSLPLFAQTFTGARVIQADASPGMREAVAAANTRWVAWTVPIAATTIACDWSSGTRCGQCALEGEGFSMGGDAPARTTSMLIAARIAGGRIERVRMFDAHCPIAARGTSVTVLTGVTPAASLGYLAGEIAAGDDDELMAALALHDHPRTVPLLIDLARHGRARVRRNALFWLGQKAGEKAAAELRHAVDADPDDDVREHAVFAISQLPREKAIPMLIDLVKRHKSRRVRERAMFWLAETEDPRALQLIKEILER